MRKKWSDEARARKSKQMRAKWNDEARAAKSEQMRAKWQDPDFREKTVSGMQGKKKKPDAWPEERRKKQAELTASFWVGDGHWAYRRKDNET